MKIAFFTDTYEPQINGVVTSISIFSKYLEKAGNEVSIFCPSPGSCRKNVFTFPSIDFHGYPGYRIAFPYQLSKIKKFDIFHVHTPFSMGLAGVAAAKFYKKPVIGTFHTRLSDVTDYLIKTRRFRKFMKSLAWRYCAWFYNMCDVVISPSPEIAPLLKSHGIKKKIVVVPNEIEIPEKLGKAALRKKYRFPGKSKILLHVGRLAKEKNVQFILKELAGKPDNWIMIITSDGPYKKELEKLVSCMGIKNVIFTGVVPAQKLNELYFLADVLLMASEIEVNSMVLLEASARGLPIVAVDTPANTNFIRRNRAGFATSRKNFYAAVKKTLESGRKTATKPFTIDKTINTLIGIYKELSHKN